MLEAVNSGLITLLFGKQFEMKRFKKCSERVQDFNCRASCSQSDQQRRQQQAERDHHEERKKLRRSAGHLSSARGRGRGRGRGGRGRY